MLFRLEDEDDELLPFEDRADAGRILASKLSEYGGRSDVVVIGLARGGLSVAFEVAKALHVPLDVMVVRKLGIPWNKELAMGAIGPMGIRVMDMSIVKHFCLSDEEIRKVADAELQELQRRERIYHHGHPPLLVAGRTVILVDDGIATGSSVQAAIASLRRQQVAGIVVATPVIAASSYDSVRMAADEVVCLAEPESFFAISQWYEDFREVTDDDVHNLLEESDRFLQTAA